MFRRPGQSSPPGGRLPRLQFGSPAWYAQHGQLDRLNLQAHHNAQTRSEEYVKEALVSHGKVGLLAQELLAAEAWRERLLPLLRGHLAWAVDSVAAYQLVYQESAVANLLEVVLFHPDACESMGEESVLELADWCARRIAYLATEGNRHAKFTGVCRVHEWWFCLDTVAVRGATEEGIQQVLHLVNCGPSSPPMVPLQSAPPSSCWHRRQRRSCWSGRLRPPLAPPTALSRCCATSPTTPPASPSAPSPASPPPMTPPWPCCRCCSGRPGCGWAGAAARSGTLEGSGWRWSLPTAWRCATRRRRSGGIPVHPGRPVSGAGEAGSCIGSSRAGNQAAIAGFVTCGQPALGLCVPRPLAPSPVQIWLALNNLLVDPVARSKLDLTAARCETLLRLQDRFSELLFDQVGADTSWMPRGTGAALPGPLKPPLSSSRCVNHRCCRTMLLRARCACLPDSPLRPDLRMPEAHELPGSMCCCRLPQLPVLRDLQRVLGELACGVNAAPPELAPSKLTVEQVPTLRSRLLARSDWATLAAAARREQFGAAAVALSRQRLEGMLRSLDFLADMEAGGAGGLGGSAAAPPTTVKVDAYRKVKEGVWEWWATYHLDINTDRPPERITTGAGGSAGGGGGAAGASAAPGKASDENQPKQPPAVGSSSGPGQPAAISKPTGLRYRLRPLAEGLQRAMPGDGKVTVLHGGHSCSASLQLPTSETRDVSALAPGVWLTVGSLAGSGLALQLKLKRLDRPTERDRVAGVWFPYVPVGGGLTVREGLVDT